MKRIYFAGALLHGHLGTETLNLYNFVGAILREAGYEVYLPHEEQIADYTPRQVWEHSHRKVGESDLLIAYVGIESYGTGIEIVMAREEFRIPVVMIVEADKFVEPRVQGAAHEFIRFQGEEDLRKVLLDAVERLLGLPN